MKFFLCGCFFLLALPRVLAQETYLKTLGHTYFGRQLKLFPASGNGWVLYEPDSFKLIRFTPCGAILWARQYGLQTGNYSGLDFFTNTRQGGFAFLARRTDALGRAEAQVTALDSLGNVLWSARYSDPQFSPTLYSIGQDKAGNFMVYANVSRNGGGVVYNMLMKISENGDLRWTRYYNHGGIWGGAIVTKDQGFLMRAGSIVMKVDSNGVEQWSRQVNSASGNHLTPVEVEDGYLIPVFTRVSLKPAFYKLNHNGVSVFPGAKSLPLTGATVNLRKRKNGRLAGIFPNQMYPQAIEFDKDLNVTRSHAMRLASPFTQIAGEDICYTADDLPVVTGTCSIGDFTFHPQPFIARTQADFTFACDTTLSIATSDEPGSVLPVATSSFLQPMETTRVQVAHMPLTDQDFYLCGKPPEPTGLQISGDSVVCPGTPGILSVSGDTAFHSLLWSTGATSKTISVDEAGTYWVRGFYACRNVFVSDTFQVRKKAFPDIRWPTDTSLCRTGNIVLSPDVPDALYRWQDGSTEKQFTVSKPGLYLVEITLSSSRCTQRLQSQVTECEWLEMPNLFTPNGDGQNDRFVAGKSKGISRCRMEIFNRWGKKIHETSDIVSKGWDGSGSTNGVYFWVLHYLGSDGKEKVTQGVVQVSSER